MLVCRGEKISEKRKMLLKQIKIRAIRGDVAMLSV